MAESRWSRRVQRWVKRVLEVALALLILTYGGPFLLLIALMVRCSLGSPVLFRDLRTGFEERTFTLLKFRTMRDAVDARGVPLPDGERLTRLGRLLRKLSLDELPQLLNVLKGEMSLVGPRPLPIRYTPWFTDEERLRFTVRPGITGLAQVSGRNETPWDRRHAYDVEYARSFSLWNDFKILIRTATQVVRGKTVTVDCGEITTLKYDFDVERRHQREAAHEHDRER